MLVNPTQSPAVLVRYGKALSPAIADCLGCQTDQQLIFKEHSDEDDQGTKKVGKVMGEYKSGTLHSGKGGKVVKNPKQAIAIAMSEAKMPMRGARTAKNMKTKGMR
jgi:hypothetical protein